MRPFFPALVAVGMAVVAQAFPTISKDENNVQLNVWTDRLAAGKVKAKALNRPVFIMIGDTVNCGYCRTFDSNILNRSQFASFIEDNPMILVMVDKANLSPSAWKLNTTGYRESDGGLSFPTLVVLNPNGTIADRFVGRDGLASSGQVYDRLAETTDQYPYGGGGGGSAPAFTSPSSGAVVGATLNVAVSIPVKASSTKTVTYSASGLPAGLAINSGTGLISGAPTAAGSSSVTVTARNDYGPATLTFTVRVAAPSAAKAEGSYQGFVRESGGQTVRGSLTMTATSAGKLSAAAVLAGKAYRFQGGWTPGTAYAAVLTSSQTDDELDLFVDAAGFLSGSLGESELLGTRVAAATEEGFSGYYTALLRVSEAAPEDDEVNNIPEGAGYLTFTVKATGTVSYGGKLADGTSFSGSSKLMTFNASDLQEWGYDGLEDGRTYACFPVYKALYSSRGSLAALVLIDMADSAQQSDNRVFLTGTEWVYPGKKSTFTDDGFVALLDDGTFTEAGAAFTKQQDLADTFDGGTFEVGQGTADVVASNSSVKLESDNDLAASLTASRTTGLFSGRFLFESDLGSSYYVRYYGVLVPGLGIGGGYYLESEKLDSGVTIQRSRAVSVSE